MADADFFLRLFSTPELRRGGSEESLLPVGKPLAVLAFLLVENRPVTREELADLLWPNADRTHGKASVRQALWNLRKVLGPDALASEDPVEFAPGTVQTDLEHFRASVEAGDPVEARKLWRGPLLAGLEFPSAKGWLHWVDHLRTLEERRFGAFLASLAQEARVAGDHRSARGWLETAVEVQPLSAPLQVALVETLLESHAFQAAGDALSAARRVLEDTEDREILDALDERLSALRTNGALEADPRSLRTEFVGRTQEFSSLAAKWRRARSGRTELALVLGDPGIGKTRLVEELGQLVASEGGTRVSVKAVEVERGLQWGGASELVRALHALPGAAGISNRSASVLAQLVPSLETLQAGLEGSRGGRVESVAVTDALLDLVSAVAEEGPILLHVDDLQWVDRESRATLSHLARNLGRESLFLVITCRTGEQDPEVKKAVESLKRFEGAVQLHLAPLTAPEVSELLALLLEEVEPEDLDSLGSRLHAIAQGNPLFIVEILKLLHNQGLLKPKGERKWLMAQSCIEGRLPVPETVESAIERRLESLGDHARLLAGQMAWQARPMLPEELRRQTGLDPFEVSEGIRELLEQDLVKRNSQERIHFVHDSITEVARKCLRVPDPHRRKNGLKARTLRGLGWGVAAATILALGLGAVGARSGRGPLGFLGVPENGEQTASYSYGKGRIFVQTLNGAYSLLPPSREGGNWRVQSAEVPVLSPRLFGPYFTPEDTLWFINHADGPDDPPYLGIPQNDGSVLQVWETAGDVGFKALSPDRKTVLLVQENLEVEGYSHMLLALAWESAKALILYRAPDMIAGADWSPDGSTVAVSAMGVRDSIHLFDPEGGRVASFGFEGVRDVGNLSWCPDSDHLVFGAYYGRRPTIGVLEASTGAFELHPSGVGGNQTPLCLGSGRHVAYQGPWNDELKLLVLDLESGVTLPVFTPGNGSKITRFSWVPDSIPIVIQSLSIQPPQPEVRWGQTTALRATGAYSDGTIRPVQVTWEALDPNRAFVDSTGVVVGNQAGTAPIVARFAGWMADTAWVRVLPWERPDVALRSDFHGHDLDKWEQFSYPPARAVEFEGDTVLSLEGDGRYRDVLISEETFSLDEGARVEVEFRLPLSRTDRQSIVFCVQPAGNDEPPAALPYPQVSSDLAFCLRYPSRELVKFDASEALAWYDRLASREYFQLPEDMDSSEWTQFALEIHPDGQVAFSVNQRLIETLITRLIIEPGTRWRIQLGGAAVDTHLYVRNVTVYSGIEESR